MGHVHTRMQSVYVLVLGRCLKPWEEEGWSVGRKESQWSRRHGQGGSSHVILTCKSRRGRTTSTPVSLISFCWSLHGTRKGTFEAGGKSSTDGGTTTNNLDYDSNIQTYQIPTKILYQTLTNESIVYESVMTLTFEFRIYEFNRKSEDVLRIHQEVGVGETLQRDLYGVKLV